ncbi:LLM class flavin-dependent oxidoreductase [Pseudonocardia kujensis]|uniref:LLM class flavin-dependent oxidoreductase n=1 Tax=Pseudonocardia kujensis TaxID=1128675 RepID=UPI001E3BEBBE|nr:LLM class flavin-dependent oxidoreductase [Pseudonocardia kujensis]MCE0765082.1 LLM class flavin-dependent oxidoreductase [Pseudonocardia kujensis]
MTGPRAPKLGLVLPDDQPVDEDIRAARLAEDAGFSTIWCYELSRDSQVRAACVAQHTTRIDVGTCVSLWHSTPVATAMRVAEIQRWSGGRFVFGLGVGTEASSRDHHDTPYSRPVGRMREYLQIVQGSWRASADLPLSFDGHSFNVQNFSGADLAGHPMPPVLLAAMGPAMVRLAFTGADGVVLSPSATPRYTEDVVHPPYRELMRTRAAAGHPVRTVAVARCSIDSDRQAARERARRSIAWYARLPAHARIAEMHGFGAEAAVISAAWDRGDPNGAVAAVSNEMVETFSLAGTPDDVRRAIRRWDGVVDSLALMTPTEGASADEISANVVAIAESLA